MGKNLNSQHLGVINITGLRREYTRCIHSIVIIITHLLVELIPGSNTTLLLALVHAIQYYYSTSTHYR
jgi:hypothetical protein